MKTQTLIQAYKQMALIRAFETRVDELFLEGVIAGTTHLCIGQEACAVGVCQALTAEDLIFSNHRGHGHLLARGADPKRLMAEIFGRASGYSGGRGGSQHIAIRDLNFMGTHGITAGTIPLAVGAALHLRRTGEPGIALVFFGDGAVSEGAFHESLNLAALWKVRVLFVCENNAYAMSSPYEKFSPVPHVADRAAAYGLSGLIADGNDVVEVEQITRAAKEQMITNNTPILLELKTYRLCGHSRGDPCIYRTREEEAQWQQKDPLARTQALLRKHHGWTTKQEAQLTRDIQQTIAEAEAFARQPEEQGCHE